MNVFTSRVNSMTQESFKLWYVSATFASCKLVAAMKLSFCIRKVLGRMTGNG